MLLFAAFFTDEVCNNNTMYIRMLLSDFYHFWSNSFWNIMMFLLKDKDWILGLESNLLLTQKYDSSGLIWIVFYYETKVILSFSSNFWVYRPQ